MATNADVKNALANRTNGKDNSVQAQPQSPTQTIAAYLKKMGPEIARALPKHMDAERLARIALTTIRTNPKLLEASIPSLLGAVMQAAQLGLEPGLIGHCYFVPFKNGKTGQTEVQFIIGYRGMIDLARRSGQIVNIYAHTVHEKDEFDYELGLHPKLVHKPAEGDRGELKFVYAVAHFKDGGYQFEVMSKAEIEKRRQRSKAANSGPWVTDYEEMAKKTVIRHMWKYLPISIEIQQAASVDETVKHDITEEPEHPDVIDITFTRESEDPEHMETAQKQEESDEPTLV